MTKYIADVYDTMGRRLYRSKAYDTRQKAADDCFAARPTARQCSSCTAVGSGDDWQPTHNRVEWHKKEMFK
jgi:hypothetical protein